MANRYWYFAILIYWFLLSSQTKLNRCLQIELWEKLYKICRNGRHRKEGRKAYTVESILDLNFRFHIWSINSKKNPLVVFSYQNWEINHQLNQEYSDPKICKDYRWKNSTKNLSKDSSKKFVKTNSSKHFVKNFVKNSSKNSQADSKLENKFSF